MSNQSQKLFKRAVKVIPGGVNSPVRAFRAVGGQPLFITRAQGAFLYDADGNAYIDYVGSWGPMILGHAQPKVLSALAKAMRNGTSYGAPTALEVELAELMVEAVPSMEKVRLVSSGTEATMSAVRLARAFTRRDKIIKFDGCYHGHSDSFLVRAGSGVATLGLPDSPGVPAAFTANTLSLPFNDIDAVKNAIRENEGAIAGVIVEPIIGNMGLIPPREGYLQALRAVTQAAGILLIFDEVMTGFRVHYGGAQGLYGIRPDLTCLGKIIGGGLPVGAYGGRKDIMSWVAPEGPMYQAGTLSGNPLAVTAGIATLNQLRRPGTYEKLEARSAQLAAGMTLIARSLGVPVTINRVGSMLTSFFTDQPVYDYASAKTSDTERYRRFFQLMLKSGVYLAPSQFEAGFVSLAHTSDDIEQTLAAAKKALKKLAHK